MSRRRRPENEFLPTFVVTFLLCCVPLGAYTAYAVSAGPAAPKTEREDMQIHDPTNEEIDKQLAALGLLERKTDPEPAKGAQAVTPAFEWPSEGTIEVVRKRYRGPNEREAPEVFPRLLFTLTLGPREGAKGIVVTPTSLKLLMEDGRPVEVPATDHPGLIGGGEFIAPMAIGEDGTLDEIIGLTELTKQARAQVEANVRAGIDDAAAADATVKRLLEHIDEDAIAQRSMDFWQPLVPAWQGTTFERGVTQERRTQRSFNVSMEVSEQVDAITTLTYEDGVSCTPTGTDSDCVAMIRASTFDQAQITAASTRIAQLFAQGADGAEVSVKSASYDERDQIITHPGTLLPGLFVTRRDMRALLEVKMNDQPAARQLTSSHERLEFTFTHSLTSR